MSAPLIIFIASCLVYTIGIGICLGLAKPQDRRDGPEVVLIAIFWPLVLACLPLFFIGWLALRGTERVLAWWRRPKPEREPLPRTPAEPFTKASKTKEPFR